LVFMVDKNINSQRKCIYKYVLIKMKS
jgi:hypothetical protein